MHNNKDQDILNNLSKEEKNKITSLNSFAKRKNLLFISSHWYVTKNEYPHTDRWSKQLVVRRNHTSKNLSPPIRKDLLNIVNKYKLPWLYKNTNWSVERLHFHLFN